MKKLLLLLFITVGCAFLFVMAISYDTGYVRISMGHWLIETNVWMLVLCLFLLVSAILFTLKALRTIVVSPHRLKQWFGWTQSERAKETTNNGLLALLEGNWPKAKRLLNRSANKSSFPLVNYLAAAHAANESGDEKEATQLLKAAYENNKDAEFAIGIAQAQIQLRTDQLESCLATLIRLRKQDPNHPYVLKLLKTVYTRLEDWQQLAKLMPNLRKIPGQDIGKLESFEKQVWQNLFILKREELQHTNKASQSAEEFAELWKQIPDKLRFDMPLIKTYAEQLMAVRQDTEAEYLLRKVLSNHWSDELIILYGLLVTKKYSEQLIAAESWLKQRPNNPALLLTLGRLALRNELWGKAWEYFNASNALHKNQTCVAELCRLSKKMNVDASKHHKLMDELLSTLTLPELPLPNSPIKAIR